MKEIKIKDIHHPGVTKEFDRLTMNDLAVLLEKRNQFIDSGCPACHSLDVDDAFEYQSLNYRRCRDCELLYISPGPTEAMHLDYVVNSTAMTYWREIANPDMRESRRPIYTERVDYSKKIFEKLDFSPKNSLELGAGNGEFAEELNGASDLEQIVVLEPQELNLGFPKVEVINGGFDELEKLDRTFDVVFGWELIEHILEPDMFLKLIRKVMAPGAVLILSTPNEKSVETRKLGTDSSNILFDHVRLYNPQAITELLARNGFRIIDLSTPGLLDVERLQEHMSKNPSAFSNDPALSFLLNSEEQTTRAFQHYLRENKHSSHMRVAAVIDGEWKGGNTPLLNSIDSEKTTTGSLFDTEQPTNFNSVVLPLGQGVKDPYPPKLMHHILHDIINVKSGKFMDLGGGWGKHAKVVADMGFDVISVDREGATPDVSSVLCDFMVKPLPFDDSSFDIVFSKSVIEHFNVRELPHIMHEIKRVLKPGGVFVILTPDWEFNMREFYQVFTHVTPYTKASLKQCLKMYGFGRVSTQNLIQLPQTWDNNLLRTLSDFTSHLPLPRSMGSWVRWSKERLLIGYCYKPVS